MINTRKRATTANPQPNLKKQPAHKHIAMEQILLVNQQYSQLLRQLAKVTFGDERGSERARML